MNCKNRRLVTHYSSEVKNAAKDSRDSKDSLKILNSLNATVTCINSGMFNHEKLKEREEGEKGAQVSGYGSVEGICGYSFYFSFYFILFFSEH